MGAGGLEVLEGCGTSLHGVSGSFKCSDFFIPAGTEYFDEIYIKPGFGIQRVAGLPKRRVGCLRRSMVASHLSPQLSPTVIRPRPPS